MDKDLNMPQDDNQWLRDFLKSKGMLAEQQSQDLTQSDELELERIVQQTLSEDWGISADDPTPVREQIEERTQRFVPVEEAPEEEEKPSQAAANGQQEMPKAKKKGYGLLGIPHILSTFIWLAIIVVIGYGLGKILWVSAADLLAFGKEPKEVTITITEKDDLEAVAKKLEVTGMIRYPKLFSMFASLTGKGEDIGVGTFQFKGDTVYDYNALIKAMIDYGPEQNVVEIMFPEGFNCAQIFELLAEKGVCTVKQLEEYAANGELSDYWFLEGVERGHKYCLEGYLAPDTYKFYTNDEPGRVLEKFLTEFDSRIDSRQKEKFEKLNDNLAKKMKANGYSGDYIETHQLTFRDVVILASIIEKETSGNVESYQIASVFFNRLADPADFPYLESDATIDYAINFYNKGELITDEQINNSPYHSYTHKGMIPGPIANPGLNSLGAALSPADTGYYYFVLDKENGYHVFSKTFREHQNNLDKLGY